MTNSKFKLLPLASAFFLQACEGASYAPQAGELFYVEVAVDGKVLSKDTYKFYSVIDDAGDLSAIPGKNDQGLPHVAVWQATTGVQPVASHSFENIQACYKEFWREERLLNPGAHGDVIAKKIGALGLGIEDLCTRTYTSGLSGHEYVVLLEAVHTYWPNDEGAEGKALGFFDDLRVTPGAFVGLLKGEGSSWSDFASRLSAKPRGVDEFVNGYRQSSVSLKTYLRSYLAHNPPAEGVVTSLMRKVTVALASAFSKDAFAAPAPAATPVVVTPEQIGKITDIVIKVTNWAWDIVKDNRPTTSTSGESISRVLSGSDSAADWTKYENAKFNSSKQVTFTGYSFLFIPVYVAKLRLATYYGATNADPAIGGQWIPSMTFTPDEIWAAWGWKLNAHATVIAPVNVGSATGPIPEVQVDVRMNASGFLSNFTRNYTFTANGATGAGPN